MPYTTALFDLDGTLLNTLEDLADAGNQVLKHFGYPDHPVASYKQFVGGGLSNLIDRISPPGLGPSDKENCISLFREIYGRNWHSKTTLYDGVATMLSRLNENGITLCILSNKPHDFTLQCAEHFFDKGLFSIIAGQQTGIPAKPHPAGALKIAERLLTAPENCVFIGDSDVDMQTGKAAQMLSIGVLWGFRNEEELLLNGADRLVSRPDEIVATLLEQTS